MTRTCHVCGAAERHWEPRWEGKGPPHRPCPVTPCRACLIEWAAAEAKALTTDNAMADGTLTTRIQRLQAVVDTTRLMASEGVG